MAALLLTAMPGALLICILHCTLAAHLPHGHSHVASPFVCNQMLEGDDLPAVSVTTVLALVQGLERGGAMVGFALTFLHLAAQAAPALRARLGEDPPAPPPRPGALATLRP